MAVDPRLLEVLACSEDKGPLLYFAKDSLLYNPRLRKKYRVEEDVPQMLLEDATVAGPEEHEALLKKAQVEHISLNF